VGVETQNLTPVKVSKRDIGDLTTLVEPNHTVVKWKGKKTPTVLAIGSSTGGPQALVKMLQDMGTIGHIPVFLTQHMPSSFTKLLAEQITRQTGWTCSEAADNTPVTNGVVWIAPGDNHLVIEGTITQPLMRLTKTPPENFCRPAVDPMLRSLAKMYGPNLVTVILTGMGQDGLLGCQEVVKAGGVVFAQDAATSTVWGMPGAVSNAGICEAVLPLGQIGQTIRQRFGVWP
jgi:two-component system, chemotaxis family, protein-glutamate methylesterase/glutaminase